MGGRASDRSGDEVSVTTRLPRTCINGYQMVGVWIDPMVWIQQRQGRYCMDEEGRVFWINGLEGHASLAEASVAGLSCPCSRSQFTEFQPAFFALLKLLKQCRQIVTEIGEVSLA